MRCQSYAAVSLSHVVLKWSITEAAWNEKKRKEKQNAANNTNTRGKSPRTKGGERNFHSQFATSSTYEPHSAARLYGNTYPISLSLSLYPPSSLSLRHRAFATNKSNK